MKLLKTLSVLSYSTALLFCVAVEAGTADTTLSVTYSDQLTMSSLVAKVYQNQPALMNQQAQQELIDAQTGLSNSLFSGQSSINLSHQNDAVLSDDGLQEWESSISMPLWLAGQKNDQTAFTDSLVAQLPSYQRQLKLDSAAQVRQALWAVIKADAESQQHYQVWQNAKKIERDVASRVEVGEMASTELLLVNTHVLEMQTVFQLAQANLKQQLDYYRAITAEPHLPSVYQESLVEPLTITENHPYLAVIDAAIASLQAQQTLAKYNGAQNPSLSLGVRRERQNSAESFNTSLGLGISFALGNDVYRQPAVAQAGQQLTEAQVSRQLTKRDLNITLTRLHNDLMAKQQQLKLVQQQLAVNKRYLALQKNAFELGEIDLVNLLSTQAIADQSTSQKRLLEVEIKYLISQVNQALGHIP